MKYLVVKKNIRCTLSALGGEEKKKALLACWQRLTPDAATVPLQNMYKWLNRSKRMGSRLLRRLALYR